MDSTIRVVKTTTNDFNTDSPITENVIWEGANIKALSKKFPKSEVFGADDLGHHEIEDGWIRWDYRFERITDGQWVAIKDPRVEIYDPKHAEREAAIDAENRRMFPGDYDNGDDDDWRDDEMDDHVDDASYWSLHADEPADPEDECGDYVENPYYALSYDFNGGWRSDDEIAELLEMLAIVNDGTHEDITADEFEVMFHGKTF